MFKKFDLTQSALKQDRENIINIRPSSNIDLIATKYKIFLFRQLNLLNSTAYG